MVSCVRGAPGTTPDSTCFSVCLVEIADFDSENQLGKFLFQARLMQMAARIAAHPATADRDRVCIKADPAQPLRVRQLANIATRVVSPLFLDAFEMMTAQRALTVFLH
ncbi:hypothetical protein B0920_11250 [Massilia sp. KIM]|nr:hypothetical protein B0920_11250 [Massilia sp. KIM]